MALICGITNFVAYSILLVERPAILNMLAGLQNELHRRMDVKADTVYKAANDRFETMVNMAVNSCLKVGMPIFTIPQMINSYYGYYSKDSDASAFRLILRVT